MVLRQRAVVFGGAGFVGSHVCERLLVDGYRVTCVDNLSTGRAINVDGFSDFGEFELLSHDVTRPFDVRGDVDLVLNLASPASPEDYHRLPVETLNAGSLGTMNTLSLAQEKTARYLFASTSEVYGDPQVHPQPEEYWGHVNPVGPRSVYDEAKRFGEALTEAYRRHRAVDTAIMRIFNTYGPRMRVADGRAVPNFINQALGGQPITVAGDGRQTRSLQYVDDLVEGCVRLLHSRRPGPINIGNPFEVTMNELAELVRDMVGGSSEIVHVRRPIDDPGQRRPDITKARQLLGWEPRTDLSEGLKRTIEYFKNNF